MTPWSWWYLAEGDDEDGDWQGDCATRAEVIAKADRDLPPGTPFAIIEARSSDAMKYEGDDYVPFLRTRNGEPLHFASNRGNKDGG